MLQSKGPESVEAKKVKGQAAEEMVSDGRVNAEDKAGNDFADEAANKSSHDDQRRLLSMTKLFSERHVAYQKFMARIQTFVIQMKFVETKVWEEKEAAEQPMNVLGKGKMFKKLVVRQV